MASAIGPIAHDFGPPIPADDISEQGCYVCHWSGHLLRVLANRAGNGQTPLVSVLGDEPLFVTRISSNPFLPYREARRLAETIVGGPARRPTPHGTAVPDGSRPRPNRSTGTTASARRSVRTRAARKKTQSRKRG